MRTRIWIWMLLLGALGLGSVGAPAGDVPAAKAWLGAVLGDSPDGGLQVFALIPGGPAELGGLERGDIILSAELRPLVHLDDLAVWLAHRSPEEQVRIQLLRAGRKLERQVELAARPEKRWPLYLGPPPAPKAPPPPAGAGSGVGCEELGLHVTSLTPDLRLHYGAPAEAGVLVTRIEPDQPAGAAGFRVGDILVRLDNLMLSEPAELARVFSTRRGSQEGGVSAVLVRGREPKRVTLSAPAVAADCWIASGAAKAGAPTVARTGETEAGLVRQAIRAEILRLQLRIRELEQQLARSEP